MIDNIIGQEIVRVIYGEVNFPNGQFYFDRFDVLDYAVNIQMKNGFWWSLSWCDEEYFELKGDTSKFSEYLKKENVKLWDATKRWAPYMKDVVENCQIIYINKTVPVGCVLTFESGRDVIVRVGEELNNDGSIPCPLRYDLWGEVYVIYDKKVLNDG